MNNRSDFDGALKDLFQQDRPTLLDRLTDGVAVREFLNVELPKVLERRVDLILLLEDDSILHIEFQSANDPLMQYRMVVYHVLLKQRYRRRLRHVVLYVGAPKCAIPEYIETESLRFACHVLDIREISAQSLLENGNPADLVLAVLAGGGPERLGEIVRRIAGLKGQVRERALAQLVVLCGLRQLSNMLEMELKELGPVIDVSDNVIIQRLIRENEQRGRNKGRQDILRAMLKTKFRRWPKWAERRLLSATPAQLDRFAKKILTAETMEGVLGNRKLEL